MIGGSGNQQTVATRKENYSIEPACITISNCGSTDSDVQKNCENIS